MNTKMWTNVPAIGAVALVAGLATFANAADYPSKRITFVVGFAAGGFADSVARIVGEHLHKKLGQNILVQNQAGAASNIAAYSVAHARADGYTVLVSTTSMAINASLYQNINYSITKEMIPVAIAVRAPESFSAAPGRPKTLKAFLEAAKAKTFSYGSAGVGSGSFLTWYSFFKLGAKIDVRHVPFKGGAKAIQAAIGGQLDGHAATASGNTVSHVTGGKLTCLAVATATRYRRLPDCPTLQELGYTGFDGSSWVGFWVPAGTPSDVIATLNKAINSISEDKQAADNLTRNGDFTGFGVKETVEFVNAEVATWAKRVQAAGIQVK
jgi:tripartite-type tricarboxylate transporter receptor subunit TctC